jgi:CheY-like chemotaxis protein
MESGQLAYAESVSVLIVDDDGAIRETVQEILQDEGYTVAIAANGADGLRVLEAVRPKLIVLDLNMPVLSGGEFRRVQRLDPSLRGIPTVVFTAAGRARESAVDLEADGYLAKPITLADLLAVVQRFCGTGVQKE